MQEPRFQFFSYRWRSSGEPQRVEKEKLPYLIARWLMLAFSVWVAAGVVGGIHLSGVLTTLAVAAILGLLNLYLRPFLFFIALPFTVVTLGFFVIVINAALLGLTSWIAGVFDLRFEVENVGSALLGAIVISVVNLMLSLFLRPKRLQP